MTLIIGNATTLASNANIGKSRADARGEDGEFSAKLDFVEPRKSGTRHPPAIPAKDIPSKVRPDPSADVDADRADQPMIDMPADSAVEPASALSLLNELVANGKGPPPEDGRSKPRHPNDTGGARSAPLDSGRNLLVTTGAGFAAAATALATAGHAIDDVRGAKDATATPATPATIRLPDSPMVTLPPALSVQSHDDPATAAMIDIAGNDAEAKTTVDIAPSAVAGRRPEPKGNPVTVLSQQNIPAPVAQPSGSTASVLVGMIAGDASWREAAAPTFRPLPAQAGLSSAHALKIQLHPAELGMVTANLRLAGEQLTVELRVETRDAYQRLTADSDTIVKSLRALGLDVDQVTIQQPQTANSPQARTEASASSAGLNARDQNQPGSGGGRDQQSAGQSRSNGNENSHGSKPAASAPSDRAGGGLYI
ncbi:flagellar hook-length control protein FliK [Pseudaminobacter sp. NGMCC 1.201702]|uniref:flagellar hook-length control protein FliK n=1 Tax=Pseudaminobacter sp. NGMCC 1.201702 TaxID=3391825 RepID=UPI0039EFD2A3